MSHSHRTPNELGGLTRRQFVQHCALGAVALGIAPVLRSRSPNEDRDGRADGPARFKWSLDRDWLFSSGPFDPAALGAEFDDSQFSRVTLPHCATRLSWETWDPAEWSREWNYRRHFVPPADFQDLRVFVHFDGVMRSFTPSINGLALERHHGGYLPARYEITSKLKSGANLLAVAVDGRPDNVPPGAPDGSARIDYLEPAGIHRSVWLEAVPKVYLSDVHAKPVDVLQPSRRLEVACTLDAAAPLTAGWKLRVELREGSRTVAAQETDVAFGPSAQTVARVTLSDLSKIKLWDVDAPHLYDVVATLSCEGRPVHDYTTRIGFRDAQFKLDGFFLNGRRLQLFGLNRHEIYPYVGFAMPARVMRRDAEMLRHQFNCNIVRCSHYPQSPAFLDACDELGLLVWEEVPGWQYIGDAVWQDRLVSDVEAMVRRDRNRAAIVIWGTRPNETVDQEALHRRSRAVARSLDDTRPVSGSITSHVRQNGQADWHEDVYAFDDYHARPDGSVGIMDPVPGVPYMLAEAVGQFNYATGEKFDSYYRRSGDVRTQCLQAVRHAQAHSRAGDNPRNCGVIGWCAFEYASFVNAHRAVKYPGVADVFRIPKLGASFYLAQISPASRAVIEPSFYWDFGAQTPRGPGKHAAIFSNCDRLEVFIGGRHHATVRPDVANYPHLAHSPCFVDLDVDGAGHPELRIDGFVGEQLRLSRKFSSDPGSDRLALNVDDRELRGDGMDATRLTFRVVDRHGAARALAEGEVRLVVEGPATIVGDNPFSLTGSGGAAAVWLKSIPGQSGPVTVEARHGRYGSEKVTIQIRPA